VDTVEETSRSNGFNVERSQVGDAMVVVPSGDIDIATCERFRRALLECEGDVIVDLSALTYLDSSGLAVLIKQVERLGESGGSLRLRNPQEPVRGVLDLVGRSHLLVD
jgi:anti-sigma B factor antagonist